MQNYSDVLESYLIPAEEALSQETKESLASIGIMTVIVAALGISQKFKEHKQRKADKAAADRVNRESQIKLKEAFKKVDQKYNLSSMSKDEYSKFVNKKYDEIIKDIEKILRPLNNRKIIEEYKSTYIADLKKWAEEANDPHKYDDDIKEANFYFKPGLFRIEENCIPDYVCIIAGDQAINTHCGDVCDKVATALEVKYSEFCDAGLFGVGTGDGDEGSVYPEFVSYETMRKRCNM